MSGPGAMSAAVEGIVDEWVIRRLFAHVGVTPGAIYGRNGKQDIHRKIKGYNNAAHRSPWIVLVDLDNDAECAPSLQQKWLPAPAPRMCFRVAVPQVEAWLLADRERISSFLAVPRDLIPANPEGLPNAKEAMVRPARKSRQRHIREVMAPRPGSNRVVGPEYASTVIEFTSAHWRPEVAVLAARSLHHTIECVRRLAGTQQNPQD